MIWLFFLVLLIILMIGLLPSLISEDRLHKYVSDVYSAEKTNLDVICDEINVNKYLIEDSFIKGHPSLVDCNCRYCFKTLVTITFEIDSSYSDCKTVKIFENVKELKIYALKGDIECQIKMNNCIDKSIFLFEDTHKLKFKIEERKYDN